MNNSNESIIFIEEIQVPTLSCGYGNCKCNQLLAAISKRKHNESDNENDNASEESYSDKRAKWYQDDVERNDCLQTVWKIDEDWQHWLTGGDNDEYSPASPEYASSPAAHEYASDPASPDVCTTWCYTCDYAYDYCNCNYRPFSPSTNYNPCAVCERERCTCLKLPIKQTDDIIVLD